MSPLVICIFVTLAAFFFIPPWPAAPARLDSASAAKATVALVFIVLVWVLFVIGGAPLRLG